jgi:hypothetical protein
MAEKLRTFDWSQPSNITPEGTDKVVYPWEEWLDGDIWQLQEGADFETHPLMMERIIRTRATARKAKVRLRHQPLNGQSPFGVIILQRTDVKGPADAKKAEQAAKRAAKKAEAEKAAAETLAKAGIKPIKKAAAKPVKKVATKHVKSGATAAAKRPAKTTKAVSKRPARKVGA